MDELYPHVSNDGSRVCFVADEGQGESKVRSVYYMNIDGTGRTLVARNARQPFWEADGSAIAYLKKRIGAIHLLVRRNRAGCLSST